MAKYFLDTEFIEHAGGIQAVSIGIVNEDHITFYAESTMFDARVASDWVRNNVIAKLHYNHISRPYENQIGVSAAGHYMGYGSESYIAEQILAYIGNDEDPEFYAYFASYDWVVFARLFGRLIDKPKHFPMWVIDLKQMMWERGLTKEWKQAICPDPEGEHNAVVDAQWNKKLFGIIMEWDRLNDHKKGNPL